jgi:DNA-binding MarR family transcriptional regulator
VESPLFSSPLLAELSELVTRWNSRPFQLAHASQLHNARDFTANKVLYLLGLEGGMRPSALAEELGSGRPNVSKVLARLEADGLVRRVRDPRDSRAQVVELTPSGEKVSLDTFRLGDDMITELTAGWSDADRETLTVLVRRLNQSSEEYQKRLLAN